MSYFIEKSLKSIAKDPQYTHTHTQFSELTFSFEKEFFNKESQCLEILILDD